MRALPITLAASVLCLGVTAASADETPTEVFGATIGAKLSLPACPPNIGLDGMVGIPGAPSSHPECVDSSDGDSVHFASGQWPDWIRSNPFEAYSTDGLVDRIDIETRGISVQDQALAELTAKFGPPTTHDVEREQNGLGATFDVIVATWTRGDGRIEFTGATSSNSGIISVEFNAYLLREQHRKDAGAHL